MINLIEAFGVAVKHYLRGEEGVYYEDLYHLVKYLPAYALPAGLHIPADSTSLDGEGPPSPPPRCEDGTIPPSDPESLRKREPQTPSVTSDSSRSTLHPPATSPRECSVNPQIPPLHRKETFDKGEMGVASSSNASEDFLLPARNPPKYYLLDQFPFSPLVALLTKGRKEGKVRVYILYIPPFILKPLLELGSCAHSRKTSQQGCHVQSPTGNLFISGTRTG